MPFIGVLLDKKVEKEFIKILTKKVKEEDIKCDIISINEKSIDNIKNIKFETILLDTNKLSVHSNLLDKILSDTKYLIINTDLNNSLDLIKNRKLTVITYGFNSKATITTSSTEEENEILCLQRNIKTVCNNIIEQQEIRLDFNSSNQYIKMGITGLMLLYGRKKL